MNNTAFSLTPLMRSTIGFDRFNDLFESVSRGDDLGNAYPPYNIEKHGDNNYQITMAVAGFKDEDISITSEGNSLTIIGKTEAKPEDKKNGKTVHYLYKGIANRSFERKFSLADHMTVQDAELKDGLLKIKLEHIVPEVLKPRAIPVNGKKALEHKK